VASTRNLSTEPNGKTSLGRQWPALSSCFSNKWLTGQPAKKPAGAAAASPSQNSLFFAQKQVKGSMASDIEDLEWGLAEVKAGKIKPLLDRALPLSKAAEAHRLIADSEVKGNIVLLPWAD